MDTEQLNSINKRVNKLEKQVAEEYITLIEILSNATFFGEMKKNNCTYAKDNQCSYFFLSNKAKNRLPIVTECKIKNCDNASQHGHIELSNLTCTLCPYWQDKQQTTQVNVAQTEKNLL